LLKAKSPGPNGQGFCIYANNGCLNKQGPDARHDVVQEKEACHTALNGLFPGFPLSKTLEQTPKRRFDRRRCAILIKTTTIRSLSWTARSGKLAQANLLSLAGRRDTMNQESTHRKFWGNTSCKLGLGIAMGVAVGLAFSAALGKSGNANNNGEVKDQQSEDKGGQRHSRQVRFLVGYYTVLALFLLWLLFDIWGRSFTLVRLIGVNEQALGDELLRTISFTIIGGAMGSLLYNMRTLHLHYCHDNYSSKWFGKYITGPWEGAFLAMVVLSLIRGGVSLFGRPPGTDVTGTNNFAVFGTGALVGFSMRDVVQWVQELATMMFTVQKPETQDTPAKGDKPKYAGVASE
jgi:hypothetical protein